MSQLVQDQEKAVFYIGRLTNARIFKTGSVIESILTFA